MAFFSRMAQLRFRPSHKGVPTGAVATRAGGLGPGGSLVIAGLPAYTGCMRYFRALAVACLALGLFVQVAAHAATAPQVRTEAQTAGAMNCSEMAHRVSTHEDAGKRHSDGDGPCDMTLGCLVAMNCIAPMALPGSVSADALFPSARAPYQPDAIVRLKSSPTPPESPPPQAALTA